MKKSEFLLYFKEHYAARIALLKAAVTLMPALNESDYLLLVSDYIRLDNVFVEARLVLSRVFMPEKYSADYTPTVPPGNPLDARSERRAILWGQRAAWIDALPSRTKKELDEFAQVLISKFEEASELIFQSFVYRRDGVSRFDIDQSFINFGVALDIYKRAIYTKAKESSSDIQKNIGAALDLAKECCHTLYSDVKIAEYYSYFNADDELPTELTIQYQKQLLHVLDTFLAPFASVFDGVINWLEPNIAAIPAPLESSDVPGEQAPVALEFNVVEYEPVLCFYRRDSKEEGVGVSTAIDLHAAGRTSMDTVLIKRVKAGVPEDVNKPCFS